MVNINKGVNQMAKNMRMFVVKYLGATDHKGTRLKITDTRHRGKSFTYSWNYKLGYLTAQALDIFKRQGIKIVGYSEPWTEDSKTYLYTDNFETLLKSERAVN